MVEEYHDEQFEYVSAETVQDLIVKTYSVLLRSFHYAQQVLALSDIVLTMKIFSLAVLVFILSYFMSDAMFLWLFANAALFYPLVYQNKRA